MVAELGRRWRSAFQTTSIISGTLLLAACGGGGGVNSSGSAAPAPTPAPVPTPTPTPPPTAADSAEYQASPAIVGAKAAYAYDRGITGKGVTIAIIDTGIDRTGSEFAGRISPDSRSFETKIARCGTCPPETIQFDLQDIKGHGTQVASVALAAKNGTGIQGIAYEATLLALKIAAPDMINVTATSAIKEGDGADAGNIAPAVVYAVDKGAFVISLSLNGVALGSIATEQRQAMDYVVKNDRLLVQSVSNFVDDKSADTGTISRNLVGNTFENRANFLFGIRVDANLNAPSGNGLPGDLADRTLAVVASNVSVTDKDGQTTTVTGNSFAAPAIAGAAALLKQYWPQLGGKAISRILLDTATDLGDKGVDQRYGVGLLNIEAAMKAQAPAAGFAAADAVLTRYSSISLSGPFGDGGRLADTVAQMTVFDRYGRDFAMTGSAGMRHQGSGLLAGAMLGAIDPPWQGGTASDTRFGFASAGVGPWGGMRSTRPATVAFSPVVGQTLTFATNGAVGQGRAITGSALRSVVAAPIGTSSTWNGHGWSAGFATGTTRDGRATLRTVSLAMPSGLGVELSDLAERGRVLGLQGATSFGVSGGRTNLATVSARRMLGPVLLSARATAATTRVAGGSDLLRFTGRLTGTAFAFDAAHPLGGGTVTLGVSSPLRLDRARAVVDAPVTFDLMTGTLSTRSAVVDLTPTAREMDVEIGWATALSATSSLRFGIAHAFDAGHVAGAQDTAGFVALVLR